MDDATQPATAGGRPASLLQQIPIEVTVSVGKARPLVRMMEHCACSFSLDGVRTSPLHIS